MGFKSLMSKAGSAALKVGSVVLKSTGAAITFANNLGVPIPGGPIVKSCIGMVTKAIDYKQKKKIELKNEGSSSASCSVMNSSMAAGPQQQHSWERQQQYNHNELTGMVRDMSCTLEPAMTTMGNQLQSMELQHETHHNQLTCRLEDMSKSGKADMIRMGNQLHKIGLQHDSQHTELTGMMEELSHSTQLSFEELSEAFQQVSSSIFFFFLTSVHIFLSILLGTC